MLDTRVLCWCVAVFLIGLLVRLALVLFVSGPGGVGGEAVAIARSLAETGRYADAYGVGVGPTAHCAPLYPILLSILVRAFGTGAAGILAINVFGCIASALAFSLLPALAVMSRVGLRAGVAAGLASALLPLNYWVQTSGAWESSLTAVALIALSMLVLRTWTAARFSASEAVVYGVAAGVALLLTPPLIPVLVAWAGVSMIVFRSRLFSVVRFFVIAALCTIAVLAPWALRNRRALGSLIWTRSNFGLELQVSNNGVMGPDLEWNVRQPEFAQFHPLIGDAERERVRQMGEVAYERAKQAQALAWISAHKVEFLRLTLKRVRLFWAPRMRRLVQSLLELTLTLLGLAGFVLLCRRRNAFAWIAGAMLVAYPAVYYIIQVSPRYRFPIEPILFLLAAYLFQAVVDSR